MNSMVRFVGVLALLLLLLLAGCNQGPPMGTVHGEVTFDGQPLKEGGIRFTPVDGQAQTGGAVIADGKFTCELPVTKMRVEINANKVVGKHRVYEGDPNSPMVDETVELIPARYNTQSELSLDVKPGRQDAKFELKK